MSEQDELTVMVKSQPIDRSELHEYIVDGLIDEMGKMPTAYFDVLVVVTVIVTPLPELGEQLPDNKDPEEQIQAMEDQQIITAAAYFVAYNGVVGNGKILTVRDIVDELKKYDNYDDTRLYHLVKANECKIDEMVGIIFSATIPE
jgi:hypothetical protein